MQNTQFGHGESDGEFRFRIYLREVPPNSMAKCIYNGIWMAQLATSLTSNAYFKSFVYMFNNPSQMDSWEQVGEPIAHTKMLIDASDPVGTVGKCTPQIRMRPGVFLTVRSHAHRSTPPQQQQQRRRSRFRLVLSWRILSCQG